jgi:hypothetical protein
MLALGDLVGVFSMRPERAPPVTVFEPSLKYLANFSDLSEGASLFCFSVDRLPEWLPGASEAVRSSARAVK